VASSIDASTTAISSNIWIEATAKDNVELRCNTYRCRGSSSVLWEGKDYDMAGIDWLKLAIEHLVENHPEVFG
jgi:hypothetical protein